MNIQQNTTASFNLLITYISTFDFIILSFDTNGPVAIRDNFTLKALANSWVPLKHYML